MKLVGPALGDEAYRGGALRVGVGARGGGGQRDLLQGILANRDQAIKSIRVFAGVGLHVDAVQRHV